MTWTGKRITDLRLKLGWSKAELGRRLGCKADRVSSWEEGLNEPSPEDIYHLDRLENQLKDYICNIQKLGYVDQVLKERSLSQIEDLELRIELEDQ